MDFDFTIESITPNSTTSLTLIGTGTLSLPSGTTAQRPGSASAGCIRWNTSLSPPAIEFYNGSTWLPISSSTTGYITVGAAATTQATATPLTYTYNIVNATSGGTAVLMPTPSYVGQTCCIENRTGGPLLYYPQVGAQIENLGANNAYGNSANGNTCFVAASTTQWYAFVSSYSQGAGISITSNPSQTNQYIFANSGVLSFNGGTTGLTPATLTTGDITLAGTLTIANGGTGQTTTAAAFNALSPLTTIGDILYANGANTSARLPGNASTTTQFLSQTGNGTTSSAPIWTPIGAASFSVNVGPSGTVAWVADTGGYYTATVTHSLGTQNVVVSLADISNNQLVQPDLITITSASVVTVRVFGNTKTLRVTVLANGASIAAGASTPSSVIVQNSGVALSGTYTTLNLVGAITATGASGVATISATGTIRTLSYYATSLDSPNNTDWAINALAPTVADPTNSAINVRQFSNTAEQGVGLLLTIPASATNIQFTYRGRPQTAPGTTANIQMNLYYRSIPNNAAISSWSAAKTFTNVGVPTNAFTQYYTYSASLATLGLTAGNEYQFELTRNTTVTSNLAYNWLMSSLDISFT